MCRVIHCVSALLHHRLLYIFTNLDEVYVHISNHWQIMMSDNVNDGFTNYKKLQLIKQMIGHIIQRNYQK